MIIAAPTAVSDQTLNPVINSTSSDIVAAYQNHAYVIKRKHCRSQPEEQIQFVVSTGGNLLRNSWKLSNMMVASLWKTL